MYRAFFGTENFLNEALDVVKEWWGDKVAEYDADKYERVTQIEIATLEKVEEIVSGCLGLCGLSEFTTTSDLGERMNETDGDLSPYKDMTREDIEKLSGLEREMAQIATGIWLSRRITINRLQKVRKFKNTSIFLGTDRRWKLISFLVAMN